MFFYGLREVREVRARILKMADKLEFSREQRAATREMLQGTFADLKEIREAMKVNNEVLKSIVEDADYDADAVADLARAQGELFARQMVIRATTRAAFNDILTDDQKTRLAELKAVRDDRGNFLKEQSRARREYFREDDRA